MDYTPQLITIAYSGIVGLLAWAWKLQEKVSNNTQKLFNIEEQRQKEDVSMAAVLQDIKTHNDRLAQTDLRLAVQDKIIIDHTALLSKMDDVLAKVSEAVTKLTVLIERNKD